MTEQIAPYGSWKSPITADLIAAGTIGLGQATIDGDDILWNEGAPRRGRTERRRANDAGWPDDRPDPPTLQRPHARPRIRRRSYLSVDGTLYFSNFADQRLYRVTPGSEPQPITPAVDLRYADGVVDRRRNRMICVREDHTVAGREAINTLVSLDLNGDAEGGQVLVSGNDFYSSPRLSPDGSRLAWLTWNHPNMPWDGTELWVGELTPDGSRGRAERVAAAWTNPSSSRSGRPTAFCISSPTAPAGGTSTAGATGASSRCARWKPSSACRSGSLACPPMPSSQPSASSAPTLSAARGIWRCSTRRPVNSNRSKLPTPTSAGMRAAPGRVVFLGGSPDGTDVGRPA